MKKNLSNDQEKSKYFQGKTMSSNEITISIVSVLIALTVFIISIIYHPDVQIEANYDKHTKCLNGVLYYKGWWGSVSPAFRQDGSLITCEVEYDSKENR